MLPLLIASLGALTAAGCRKHADGSSDVIAIGGSSTVFPITEAVAEAFREHSGARVTIAVSGTGGGFQKLCRGEIAISGASRPIKPSEVALCNKHDVGYIELPVAYDGIAVVVHRENGWVRQLSVDQLARLWRPAAQNKLTRWSQLSAGWPDEPIHLFGPGVASGTYDYFTKAIVGREHASRGDFTSSEDDNVLAQGIATDPLALGFFGYAYYFENQERLELVPIDDGRADNGEGAIAPSPATIGDGTYQPLSRPVFIYVARAAASRPGVKAFVEFYLDRGAKLVEATGYVPLPPRAYTLARRRFAHRVTGSIFAGSGARVGVTVRQLLKHEGE